MNRGIDKSPTPKRGEADRDIMVGRWVMTGSMALVTYLPMHEKNTSARSNNEISIDITEWYVCDSSYWDFIIFVGWDSKPFFFKGKRYRFLGNHRANNNGNMQGSYCLRRFSVGSETFSTGADSFVELGIAADCHWTLPA
jgi:hypothetical protein